MTVSLGLLARRNLSSLDWTRLRARCFPHALVCDGQAGSHTPVIELLKISLSENQNRTKRGICWTW